MDEVLVPPDDVKGIDLTEARLEDRVRRRRARCASWGTRCSASASAAISASSATPSPRRSRTSCSTCWRTSTTCRSTTRTWSSYLELLRRAVHRLQPARADAGARQGHLEEAPLLPPHPGARVRGVPHGQRGPPPAAARLPADRQVAHQGGLGGHRADVARRRRRQAAPSASSSSTSGCAPTPSSSATSTAASSTSASSATQRLQVFPVWELLFTKVPEEAPRIATEQVKWDAAYRERHGIKTSRRRRRCPTRWSCASGISASASIARSS